MTALRKHGQAKINFLFFQDIITSVMGILILITLMLSFSLNTGEASTEQRELQSTLDQKRAELTRLETENESTHRRQLEAATLPDRAALEAEIARLRQQLSQLTTTERAVPSPARARENQSAADSLRRDLAAMDAQLEQLRARQSSLAANTNALFIIPDAETAASAKQPVAIVVTDSNLQVRHISSTDHEEIAIASNADAAALRKAMQIFKPDRDLLIFYFKPSGAKWFDPLRAAARAAGFEVGYDAIEERSDLSFTTAPAPKP